MTSITSTLYEDRGQPVTPDLINWSQPSSKMARWHESLPWSHNVPATEGWEWN